MHFTLLFLLIAQAATRDVQTPLFRVVSESPAGIDLAFNCSRLRATDYAKGGMSDHDLSLPGLSGFRSQGSPDLPFFGRYVAIPQGAQVRVVMLDSRREVYRDVEVAPAPNIPLETDDAPLRYEKDMAIYGRDAYYPASPVMVSEPRRMRGVDVVIVNVTPFQYNPVTKELVVYRDLRFRLEYVGGNGHFGEDRLRSRFWEPILQGQLLNYDQLPVVDFYAPARVGARDGWEYIIIVPDDPVFEAWADTIKAWRKLQGISCEVFTLTEVGGNTTTAIENFLNNAYNTWDPAPVAFLLLSDYQSSGDVYGITSPLWSGTGGSCVSDNVYADVDNDDLPDMHHARICAQSDAQLDTMINKFLSYEREPYTAPNFYNEPLVACGWQTDRWFQICAETVRGFLINELGKNPARQYHGGSPTPGCAWSTNSNTPIVVAYFGTAGVGYIPDTNPYDVSWWNNGTAAGINDAINSGAFLVQHRDHGGETGWSDPPYYNSNINSLTNTMYTFVFSTNCLTGKYNWYNECFTEKFHRFTYGALGLNSASETSYSFVNDTYVWGMYDCLWPQFLPDYPGYDTVPMPGYGNLRPCMAMTSGKYFLHQSSWPSIPEYKSITNNLFHHHGDVFFTLYSEIPESLFVSHPSTLTAGVTSFPVSADDSSIIALTVDGEIIGVAEGTGAPTPIIIPPQIPSSIVRVTVTKANHYRYVADVPVEASNTPYVVVVSDIIDDTTGGNGDGIVNPGETIEYGIWAKNVGIGQAQGVYGLLTASDTCLAMLVDSSWYGNINENDSILSDPYYGYSITPYCPNGHTVHFTLHFHDANDSIYTSYTTITVYAPILTFQTATVMDTNGIVDPGDTVDLVITIENEGGAIASNITTQLATNSSYVTIVDDAAMFGSIPPGDTANNAADPYTIAADTSTPTGTVADFQIYLTSGVYTDTLDFSLVIGKKHYYIWNPDVTPTPGQNMHAILDSLGYSGDIGSLLATDLNLYQSVFVCLGIYPNNYVISNASPEATALVNYLQNQNGRVYLEGNDVWYFDPPSGYNFCPLFGIDAIADGTDDMGPVVGETNTFTQGMTFQYAGENEYMDHINSTGSGFVIFHDGDDYYNCGVANDAGTYRTVGTSFELGMLVDSLAPSTRAVLLDSIMRFFGIVGGTGIDEYTDAPEMPLNTALAALYPNPGTRVMQIRYQLARGSRVSLLMYDAAGRMVCALIDEFKEPGYYTIAWDGHDDIGRKVPAGVYFIRFNADDCKQVQKMVLLK
jgi:hypothetical protein